MDNFNFVRWDNNRIHIMDYNNDSNRTICGIDYVNECSIFKIIETDNLNKLCKRCLKKQPLMLEINYKITIKRHSNRKEKPVGYKDTTWQETITHHQGEVTCDVCGYIATQVGKIGNDITHEYTCNKCGKWLCHNHRIEVYNNKDKQYCRLCKECLNKSTYQEYSRVSSEYQGD